VRIRLLPLALAAAVVLAGCLGAQTEPVNDEPVTANEKPFVDPIIDAATGHDHSDPAQHALFTESMRKLGYTSLGETENTTRGTYGEIDIAGDTAFVAVLGDGGETPGVLTLDITDRVHPKVLSFTPVPFTRLADVKADPSGDYFFVGAQAWTLSASAPTKK